VAFAADRPLSPRGERALAIAQAAERIADTEVIWPVGRTGLRRRLRQLTHLASPVVLDAWEPEAWWMMRRRRRRPDAALLVGFPFSAVYWGARWLVREGVSYVVDAGDPWALTESPDERLPSGQLRAARCERFIWRHASAAVVTTDMQADALRRLFPALPVVVRPNGYRPAPLPAPAGSRPGSDRTLRLVHYGNLYGPRLDIAPLLSRLAASGEWDSVVFTQQGDDWTGALNQMPPTVRVQTGRQQPWNEVVAAATQHDLAVVVGNHNPATLPSKAVQYLTLPIPRLAVVGADPGNALTAYVRDKPGWLTLRWDAPKDAAAAAVAAHVRRAWTRDQLAPPPGESWDDVASALVDVLRAYTAGARLPGTSPSLDLAAGHRRREDEPAEVI
jgi:hypothetical protein